MINLSAMSLGNDIQSPTPNNLDLILGRAVHKLFARGCIGALALTGSNYLDKDELDFGR